jgi:hypothetical protein
MERSAADRHGLAVEMLPLSSLVPWTRNPRDNDAAAVRLAQTIDAHGWTTPILVQAWSMRIIGGHTRAKAAAILGLSSVPCITLDVDDRQADAIAIADNRLGELAEWDQDGLGALLRELSEGGADMAAIGYQDDELADLLGALDAQGSVGGPADGEVTEPPEEPDSVLGGVYELGPHRLVCGDSTDGAVVGLALAGHRPAALIGDPPFGISVVGSNGEIGASVMASTGVYRPVIGDDEEFDPAPFVGLADVVALFGANYFPTRLPCAGQWSVWDKNRPEGLGFSDCELLWTNRTGVAVKKYSVTWNGMIREGESDKRVHPTQKPLLLMDAIISDLTTAGADVLDPWGGSGTTLIAAARTGRVARLIELDPGYCDVIRRRWTTWAEQAGVDPGPGALR